MTEGLSVYLVAIYGKDTIRRFFPMETWKNLKGWKWNRLKQRLIAPEIRSMKRLCKHNLLVEILAMEQLTLQEELQGEEKEIELKT